MHQLVNPAINSEVYRTVVLNRNIYSRELSSQFGTSCNDELLMKENSSTRYYYKLTLPY